MRSGNFIRVFTVLIGFILTFAGADVFSQGKGKGQGGGKGGGQGQVATPKQGGDPGRGQGRPAAAPQIRQPGPGGQGRGNPNIRPQMPQRQPRIVRPANPGWLGRGRGGEDRRQRVRSVQNERQPQIVPQPKIRTWPHQQVMQEARGDDRRGRGRNKEIRTAGREFPRVPQTVNVPRRPPLSGDWPDNYGQQRRREVHLRNAERKALKDAVKFERRALRDGRDARLFAAPAPLWQQEYIPNYVAPGFGENYVVSGYGYPATTYVVPGMTTFSYSPLYSPLYSETYYYERPMSGTDLLRNIIFSVLGGDTMTFDTYFVRYGPSYIPPAYYGAYSPQYVGYSYAPYYTTPYYSNAGYVDPYYHDRYYSDPYYEELPVAYFINAGSPGGGLFREMFSHLLAMGYDQGYRDGLAARRLRERERYFYDPYAYDNVVYDPYSVSLGYNRRCLSQGYELGYYDALSNVRVYDRFRDPEIDLVSVLIGTVSQLM